MCSMLHAPSPLIVRHRVSVWVSEWVSEWVSGCVSGWELLPGVFALNHRILMPHHARSGSVKRATKPESATRIRNRDRPGQRQRRRQGQRWDMGNGNRNRNWNQPKSVTPVCQRFCLPVCRMGAPSPSPGTLRTLHKRKYTYNTIKLLFTRFWKEKVQGVYGAHETWFHFNLSSSEFVALFVPA